VKRKGKVGGRENGRRARQRRTNGGKRRMKEETENEIKRRRGRRELGMESQRQDGKTMAGVRVKAGGMR